MYEFSNLDSFNIIMCRFNPQKLVVYRKDSKIYAKLNFIECLNFTVLEFGSWQCVLNFLQSIHNGYIFIF